jgi:hypothetical protein
VEVYTKCTLTYYPISVLVTFSRQMSKYTPPPTPQTSLLHYTYSFLNSLDTRPTGHLWQTKHFNTYCELRDTLTFTSVKIISYSPLGNFLKNYNGPQSHLGMVFNVRNRTGCEASKVECFEMHKKL